MHKIKNARAKTAVHGSVRGIFAFLNLLVTPDEDWPEEDWPE
jgi:hypothetical protein